MNNIENVRIKNETKQRDKKMMPSKADPYHNANTDSEYKKIALQKGKIGIQDVTDLQLDPTTVVDEVEKIEVDKNAPTPDPDGGRPKFSLDQGPRKKKRVLPKNSPNLGSLTIWATQAQEKVSQYLNSEILNVHGKKNLRELSKAQLQDLEELKFTVLCKIDPYSDIDEEVIKASLPEDLKVEKEFLDIKDEMYSDFVEKNQRTPSIDEMRQIYNLSYSFRFFS